MIEPLNTLEGIQGAIKQDSKLSFDPNLKKTYLKLGGALSNNAIPSFEPIIISPQRAEKAIKTAQEKSAMLSPILEKPEKPKEEKIEKPEPLTLINSETLSEETFIDPSLNRQRVGDLMSTGNYQVSSGTLPTGIMADGKIDEIQAKSDEYKKEIADYTTKLKSLNVMNDPEFQLIASGIESQWNERITSMQQINKSRTGSMTQLGTRLGSRYLAGGMAGIISEEEKQGINRINELETKKQSALAQAQKSFRTEKWNEYVDLINIAEKRYNEEVDEIDKLNKKVTEENKKLDEENLNINRDTTISELNGLGITDRNEVLKYLNDNGVKSTLKQVDDALKILETTDDLVGTSSDLRTFKKFFPNVDITTPEGLQKFDEFTNRLKDELLSPTEAKTLGVPYGTTKSQAAKMGIIPKSTSDVKIFSKEEIARLELAGVSEDVYTNITKLLYAGKEKEEIKRILEESDLDPILLDIYDRVIGIKKITGQKEEPSWLNQ